MIDVLIFVGIVLIAVIPPLLSRKTDNRNWLELKENAEECLSRYSGDMITSGSSGLSLNLGLCVRRLPNAPIFGTQREVNFTRTTLPRSREILLS